MRVNVAQVVKGKDEVVHLVVVCLVAEGHCLVEDAPGMGKTTMAKALARSVDGTFGRIQFTPDLLPADVVGTSIWNRTSGSFEFRHGAIFHNVVLADEINRASPKTQSALLEAMAERQVTVDGTTHDLDRPFLVVATQNPLDHEGTYPLPESQLDRFLMRLSVGYPPSDAELELLASHGVSDDAAILAALTPVVSTAEVMGMTRALNSVHVDPGLRRYLVELAAATRQHQSLALGASPRAVLSLQRAAQAHAASQGRTFIAPDDIKYLAEPVLTHRLLVSPQAQLQSVDAGAVLRDVLDRVPVPAGVVG
ncbi:MAG: MoxR family ATPase [Acidimicrobiia bacterium]|nr:MoxR family ATPase [Acidimicrobiia bacterium]